MGLLIVQSYDLHGMSLEVRFRTKADPSRWKQSKDSCSLHYIYPWTVCASDFINIGKAEIVAGIFVFILAGGTLRRIHRVENVSRSSKEYRWLKNLKRQGQVGK